MDSAPQIVTALFKTQDPDSGENREVKCLVQENTLFRIDSFTNNYYKLVTDGALEWEQTLECNVTITAADRNKASLSSSRSITQHSGDVNNNAPVFHQSS